MFWTFPRDRHLAEPKIRPYLMKIWGECQIRPGGRNFCRRGKRGPKFLICSTGRSLRAYGGGGEREGRGMEVDVLGGRGWKEEFVLHPSLQGVREKKTSTKSL